MSNIKVLSDRDVQTLEDKFDIVANEELNLLLVSLKKYNKTTAHKLDETVSLNVLGLRRITFSPKMIKLWIEMIKDGNNISLFKVHQLVATLLSTYQDVTLENLKTLVTKNTTRIKEI